MVLSLIDSTISYTELKSLAKGDGEKESDLYQIEVLGVPVIVAIGNVNKTHESKNVDYFPLYLVKSNSKVMQIGIYEVKSSDLMNYLDDEGQLNLEKIGEPLLYTFVTSKMLKNLRLEPDEDDIVEEEISKKKKDDDDDDENDNDKNEKGDKNKKSKKGQSDETTKEKKNTLSNDLEIPAVRKDIFTLSQGVVIPDLLKEEYKADADKQRTKYEEKKDKAWIETYMKNNKYYIVDNEGGGDCFFATIRDAFGQLGQQTTIRKLREKLANEISQEVFLGYKEQYDMLKTSVLQDTQHIKELGNEYEKYKKKFTDTLDRNEKKLYVENSKKIKAQHDQFVKEKRVTNELLREFVFMKEIDTLEKFKEKIKTCEFWADTWAISTLERILNVKFVLLSSEAYKEKDTSNVLQCGQLNDVILESRGEFTPDYYILLDYTGNHYKLIGYKKKQIFQFSELPFDLKRKVVDKCMEKNAGLFALIPDFQRFKKTLGLAAEHPPQFDELSDAKIRGLYDDNVVFVFHSGSTSKKIPGKGVGETVPKELVRDFAELAAFGDWRKKLDDSWIQPFLLDGKRWNSVEHFYQASKFKKENPEFYLSFSAESGTPLSKNSEMAKAAGTTGKYEGELLRPKEVSVDPDFHGKCKEQVVEEAQLAKFTQSGDLRGILLATKNAKLMHYKKGKPAVFVESLVNVREKLKKQGR
jgi:predicted NAD-dependent protein-ADP-ribosyltransferase YbiA (DUF1768 family)